MLQDGAVCPMCEWMMGLGWGGMLITGLFYARGEIDRDEYLRMRRDMEAEGQ